MNYNITLIMDVTSFAVIIIVAIATIKFIFDIPSIYIIQFVLKRLADKTIINALNLDKIREIASSTPLEAIILVEKYNLGKNIVIFDKTNSIIIKNLEIEVRVDLEFSHFNQVSFMYNMFIDHTSIKMTNSDSIEGKFVGNHAIKNLRIAIYNDSNTPSTKNKYLVNFEYNKIFNLHIADYPSKEDSNRQFCATDIMLTDNHIGTCHICDQSTSLNTDPHINNIRFKGGNILKQLIMQTKYNILTETNRKTNVEKISYGAGDTIFPLKQENENTLHSYMNYFAELHKKSLDKKHILSTAYYARQVKLISCSLMSRTQDKFVLLWGEFASSSGTSWTKAGMCLTISQTYLVLIIYLLFDQPILLSEGGFPIEKNWEYFFSLLVQFMNPATLTSSIPIIETSWQIHVILFLQKLLTILFYYEIVQALRRFAK